MKILNQFTTVSLLLAGISAESQTVHKPNIIYILADDLGYGDVHCFNPERGKIATPNMDKLAGQGMVFTDMHSSSSVCTPTRYGILTGRYNWRTHLQSGVLTGFSEPLIDVNRLTVPALLKQHGYTTACIGKWHLGMGIPKDEPSPHITNGPTTRGFDSYFGISASLDMPPFAFIENDHLTEPLTTSKKWIRTGPAAAGFEAIDVLPTLTQKAVEYISKQAKTGNPFFLYLPLNSPHTPILPTKEWQGKSGISPYGDFVMETDWAIGQVIDAIEKEGIGNNTLVIITSDNGCSKAANIQELEEKGHFPSAWFRGSKSDLWDGGHHIPFIARWPAIVAPGSTCNQLACLTDLMATCADIVGAKLPGNAGEDSFSFLQALKGKPIVSSRAGVIHHSILGYFSYRQGNWKLLLSKGSGGWTSPTEKELADSALVAISAEYRVKSRNNTSPFEAVKDAKSAVRWVRQHAKELGVNPDKIVSAGGSAGGHIACCTGVIEGMEEDGADLAISSVPNAMILFNPVLDTSEKGYGLDKVGATRMTEISPCHHVRPGIVPTLLIHLKNLCKALHNIINAYNLNCFFILVNS